MPCNPVRFILTGGERNDITQIEGLLEGLKAGHVLADKGYDGQRAMDAIAATGAKPVVPRRTTTASWRSFDAAESEWLVRHTRMTSANLIRSKGPNCVGTETQSCR